MDNTLFFIAFACYFTILFGIAFLSKMRTSSSSDLVLGKRSLNFWVTAISAHASDMSSWLFLAFPVSLYVGGAPQAWIAIALVVGMFLNWHLIAPRLRTNTEAVGASTIADFFAKKFPARGETLRILSALITILFLVWYLSAGMIGVGLVFESLFQLNYLFGLIFATTIVIGYTFIGGFVSVAWADLFQGLFLLAVIVLVPYSALMHVGGLNTVCDSIAQSGLNISLFGENVSWKDIIYPFFGWGLGYFGMPHIITKFMAIQKPKDLVKSKYLGVSWQIITLGASAACGLIAVAFFQEPLANPETIFIEMSRQLFSPLVVGFVMCGIVAATISTMDSQILTAASMASEDLLQRIFPTKSEKMKSLFFRGSVLLLSLAALFLASTKSTTIMDTVYFAWSGLGASFGPLMLFCLYSKKLDADAALVGIVTGSTLSLLWPSINRSLTAYGIIDHVPSMIPAFLSSVAVLWLLPILKRNRS